MPLAAEGRSAEGRSSLSLRPLATIRGQHMRAEGAPSLPRAPARSAQPAVHSGVPGAGIALPRGRAHEGAPATRAVLRADRSRRGRRVLYAALWTLFGTRDERRVAIYYIIGQPV